MSNQDSLELAMDLYESGQIDRARDICHLLFQQNQENSLLLFLMGLIAIKEKKTSDALIRFEAAVSLDPAVPEYMYSLGKAYFDMGRFEDAWRIFEELGAAAQDQILPTFGKAQCLAATGEFDQAEEQFTETVELSPGDAEIRLEYGYFLSELGRWNEAADQFKAGAEIDPLNSKMIFFLIKSLANSGQIDSAYEQFKRAVVMDEMGPFLVSQAAALLPIIPRSRSEMNKARDCYEEAVSKLATRNSKFDEQGLLGTQVQFMAAYQCRNNESAQRKIGKYFAENCPSLTFKAPHVDSLTRAGRLKIGFISAHFYNHSIGKLNHGIIANLDREKFEVVVVSSRPPEDEIGRYIQEHCDAYFTVPTHLAKARRIISDAEFDIIFYPDIGMEPLTYFLAFSRLARLQCVGWGHPMTTGIGNLDYFMSAEDLELEEDKVDTTHYSEELVKLPHPLAYHHASEFTARIKSPSLDFETEGALYVCLQTLFKIHPDFDDIIIEILRLDSTGHALFIEGKAGWSHTLLARWKNIGPDVVDRIHFVPHMSQPEFFGLVRMADVILDTIHFSGGTSSIETFGLDRPIVTLLSETLHSGRVTGAYYRQMGIEHGLALNKQDYIDIAVRMGTDSDYRNMVEELIRANRHKLFQRLDIVDNFSNFLIEAYDLKAI